MKTVTRPQPKLRPAVGNFAEQAPQRATDPLDHPHQCRIAPATLMGNVYSFKRLPDLLHAHKDRKSEILPVSAPAAGISASEET